MNKVTAIARRIRAALFRASTGAKVTESAPPRVKLAGRRGYGEDGTPTQNG